MPQRPSESRRLLIDLLQDRLLRPRGIDRLEEAIASAARAVDGWLSWNPRQRTEVIERLLHRVRARRTRFSPPAADADARWEEEIPFWLELHEEPMREGGVQYGLRGGSRHDTIADIRSAYARLHPFLFFARIRATFPYPPRESSADASSRLWHRFYAAALACAPRVVDGFDTLRVGDVYITYVAQAILFLQAVVEFGLVSRYPAWWMRLVRHPDIVYILFLHRLLEHDSAFLSQASEVPQNVYAFHQLLQRSSLGRFPQSLLHVPGVEEIERFLAETDEETGTARATALLQQGEALLSQVREEILGEESLLNLDEEEEEEEETLPEQDASPAPSAPSSGTQGMQRVTEINRTLAEEVHQLLVRADNGDIVQASIAVRQLVRSRTDAKVYAVVQFAGGRIIGISAWHEGSETGRILRTYTAVDGDWVHAGRGRALFEEKLRWFRELHPKMKLPVKVGAENFPMLRILARHAATITGVEMRSGRVILEVEV